MNEKGIPKIFTDQSREGFFGKFGIKSKISIVIIIFALFGVGGYVIYKKITEQIAEIAQNEESQTSSSKETKSVARVETPESRETVEIPLFGDANFQSENFRLGGVAIGGEAEFLLTEDSPEPFATSSIRGESFTEKNKKDVKLVVTWKTNKLAQSEITYSKGVGQPSKTIAEDDFSINHNIIIPGLDQASTYVYKIKSADRFGNQIESEPYAVYTGSRAVSLFDLIAAAVGDVFGWAIKNKG